MALPHAERRRLFADPAFRASLDGGAGGFVASLAASWDRLVLRVAASEANARWQDQSVAEVARARGVRPADAFCDLVLGDDLGGQWGALVMNTDEAEMAAMIRHPAGQVALSDAGAHMDTLCDQGFTTSLLGHWVRDRGLLPLAEAVRLVSALPAERFGLAERGRIVEGAAADLVVFDADRVGTRPTEVVHDLPGGRGRLLQEAIGIEWVLVNGEAVVMHGVPTAARPGRVLRGGRG
jgi:N-acyl-D-amino-acid deacylase